jgi:hypothetical protein
MAKILLSFFDYTGNWSKPFKDDPYWHVKSSEVLLRLVLHTHFTKLIIK